MQLQEEAAEFFGQTSDVSFNSSPFNLFASVEPTAEVNRRNVYFWVCSPQESGTIIALVKHLTVIVT